MDQNISRTKQPAMRLQRISLKPRGGIPGDASSAQSTFEAASGEQYSLMNCASPTARILFCPCPKSDLYALWQTAG